METEPFAAAYLGTAEWTPRPSNLLAPQPHTVGQGRWKAGWRTRRPPGPLRVAALLSRWACCSSSPPQAVWGAGVRLPEHQAGGGTEEGAEDKGRWAVRTWGKNWSAGPGSVPPKCRAGKSREGPRSEPESTAPAPQGPGHTPEQPRPQAPSSQGGQWGGGRRGLREENHRPGARRPVSPGTHSTMP